METTNTTTTTSQNPKIIKLWFTKEYNVYFPKTAKDCEALWNANWQGIPCFTPPGVLHPDLNSIDHLYAFLSAKEEDLGPFLLQLGNYRPEHLRMAQESHKKVLVTETEPFPSASSTQDGEQE